jgi:hypothetical protein
VTILTPLAVAVLATQGVLMLVDEFGFHRRRDMPRWERLGHPVDTLSVLAPVLLALLLPPEKPWVVLFVALAIFSSLLVTKDEAVHSRLCSAGEQWLHAVLFLLHPLVFAAVWILWKEGEGVWVALQAALTAGFFAWQLLYWNGPWAPTWRRR